MSNQPSNTSGEFAPWVTKYGLAYPYGKCQCGCGQDTPLATRTRSGLTKGQPIAYIHGHSKTKAPATFAPWVEKHGLQFPYGKCQCGCGNDAPLASQSHAKRLLLKGHPYRFLPGHAARVSFKYETLRDAFDAQVNKGAPDECWICKSIGSTGYGVVSFRGYPYKAHRLAYTLFVGDIPDGLGALHHCDNRRCANPAHLFLGTNADNVADKMAKGRQPKGEKVGTYKHGKYVGWHKRKTLRLTTPMLIGVAMRVIVTNTDIERTINSLFVNDGDCAPDGTLHAMILEAERDEAWYEAELQDLRDGMDDTDFFRYGC